MATETDRKQLNQTVENYRDALEMQEALGPNSAQASAFLELCAALPAARWAKVVAAWDSMPYSGQVAVRKAEEAAWVAARAAAREAAWSVAREGARSAVDDAARHAALVAAAAIDQVAAAAVARPVAREAAKEAAEEAAWAYVVRDLLTQECFETLVAPFCEAGIELP